MKKYKKIIITSAVILSLIVTVLFIIGDEDYNTTDSTKMVDGNQIDESSEEMIQNNKVYVKTVNPVIEQLIVTTQSGGQIERKEEKLTYESFPGRIKKIFVEEGSYVKKGDKILELDKTSEILQLEAAIQSNKSSIDLISNEIDFNQERLKKKIQLQELGMVASEEISQLQLQIDTLNLRLEDKKTNMEIVNRSIADIQKKSIVRSGIDGTIKNITLQEERKAGTPDLIHIVDTDNLYCKAYVSEKLIESITMYQGEKVNVEIPALNKIVKGEIVKIEQETPETKFLYPIKIKIENIDNALTNMSTTTHLVIYKNEKALLIPNKSVILDGEDTYVYKVENDNTVTRVDVKKLYYKDDLVEVEGDINADDTIIVEGYNKVREGNIVEIVN